MYDDETPQADPPPIPAPSLDEIEERLAAALDRAKGLSTSEDEEANDARAARLERLEATIDQGTGTRMPDETELDGALREVEAKVRGVQEQRARKAAETDRVRRADQETARGLGTGLAVAYALIGLPMAGAGLGWLLDKTTKSSVFLPVFAILGMVAAIWWTVRTTNRQDPR